ncbi:hypothetical protein QFZ31_001282 [Neobacillus niacini]|uniref:DUF6944 family repetitive protein n=1 Tax=Neobacillus driksii TaxID=3035913 RepID=UPI00278413B8|nr:hypothetical protein [Neobacillus niacini]MDQ0971404.1 hypothetical protein [Neobacillus niacini]
MTIRGEDLLISGTWLLVVGSLIDTIGQTQQTFTHSDLGKDLIIKGNGIEACGNSLQAIGRTKLLTSERELPQIYTIFGNWIEAAGNTTNSVGVSIDMNGAEGEGIKLDTLGSGVQGLGAAFEAIGAALEEDSSYRTLAITGNSFVSLGSFLGAIGNIYVINEKNEIGDQILLVSSLIQFIGAVLLINAITQEVEYMEHGENLKNGNGDSYPYSYNNYSLTKP